MKRFQRAELLDRFNDLVHRRVPIVGGGAGIGLSAKWEEAGGIDLIVIYNSGRFRMAGHGSLAGLLAYGNANEIVVDMAKEVLPVVKDTPVLAGVNATDPFLDTPHFLNHLRDIGFAGAGADMIVCHLGLTTGGSIGAETALTLADCVPKIEAWADAARQVRDDVIVLVHGGPISMPEDAQYILSNTRGVHGFYGASSMERLPAEQALKTQTEAFKAISFGADG